MIKEIQHLSMSSLIICTCTFVKCLFKSFGHIYCIVCLLILKFRSSLHIFWIQNLCWLRCKHFFPDSHFIFLTMSFREQNFLTLVRQMSMYPLLLHYLYYYVLSLEIWYTILHICGGFFQNYFVYSSSFTFPSKFVVKFAKIQRCMLQFWLWLHWIYRAICRELIS